MLFYYQVLLFNTPSFVPISIVTIIGPISTSPVIINSLSRIARGRVDGLLRLKSISAIINTYINLIFTIITTYISPLVTIINTHITHFISMNTLSYSLIFKNILSTEEEKMIILTIYHGHLGYLGKSGLCETYIYLSHKHQILIHNCDRKSVLSFETYIHIYHSHHSDPHHDKLHDLERKSDWYLETYIQLYHHHHYDKLHDCERMVFFSQ